MPDIFISYASEDKKQFVEELAYKLKECGLSIWYDDFSLKIGDSLRESIDKGLSQCQWGIVILSHNFFRKNWPQKELGALYAKETQGHSIILPIWHGITADEIAFYSPTLADKIAVQSSDGIDSVVEKILEVINPDLIREKANSISEIINLSSMIKDYLESNLIIANRLEENINISAEKTIACLGILTDALEIVGKVPNNYHF